MTKLVGDDTDLPWQEAVDGDEPSSEIRVIDVDDVEWVDLTRHTHEWGPTERLETAKEYDRLSAAIAAKLLKVTAAAPDAVEHPATPEAPRAAEFLAGLFCSRDLRESTLGDLAEMFEERAATRGLRKAQFWYWWQVFRSSGMFAWRWARRLMELDALLQRIGL